MARTTPALVAKIANIDSEEVPDVTPFIEAANALVTSECTESDYSDAKLEVIERWLAAHFYHIRIPELERDDIGQLRNTAMHKVDLLLNQTRYGQMAMLLDTAGNLAAMNNAMLKVTKHLPGSGKTATMTWLGKAPESDEVVEAE